MPRILAIRTPRYGYIDYLRGKSELYNMTRDPFQTHGLMVNPPDAALTRLRERLGHLRGCNGQGCRTAEGP